MNGQIADHPLIEVIREIQDRRLRGVLRLERKSVKFYVYFADGHIIFAISNLRAHRIDACLLEWKNISPAQLAEAQKHAASELELMSFLVISATLTRGEMNDALMRRTADIVRTSLLWPDGEWSFEPQVKPAQEAHPPINAGELFAERARRLPPDVIASRFPDGAEKFSPEKLTAVPTLNLQPAEAFVFSRADQPVTLSEIMTLSGLPEVEAMRALYVLSVGGLLRRSSWLPVLEAAKATTPAAAAQPTAKIGAEHAPAPPDNPKEMDQQTRLGELLRHAGGSDFYEVLGLTRHTEPESVKQAYYALARKFHPDRFHAKNDAALRARIEQAFTRIKKAYDTLKGEGSRASYDLSLGITPLEQPSNAEPSAAAAPPSPIPETPPAPPINPPSFGALNSLSMAEEKFKQGVREYENGNDTLAVAHFSEAVQLERREPRYHAYYARALARNAQTRRMAEAEFLEAISLDGRNVSYRVMLAELYRDLNLKRRAESQLTQALTIDPQHVDVRRLLGQLRSA